MRKKGKISGESDGSFRNIFARITVHIILILFAAVCLIPLILVISVSMTSNDDIFKYGYAIIPRHIDLSSYVFILKSPGQLIRSYMVTIFVTTVGTCLGLLITAMLAYGMARKDYLFSKLTTFITFFTMLFSAGLVPWYMLITNGLRLKDTIWVLIIPYLIIPWFAMLMKGFLSDIPMEIIESGKVDGASEFRIFFRLVMPIAKPGLATVALFIMLMYWNDYYLSLMFIQDSKVISLQFMLYRMMSNLDFLKNALGGQTMMLGGVKIPDQSVRMAMCMLAAGPMLFVFPFFQKYFTKGIIVGSVKG